MVFLRLYIKLINVEFYISPTLKFYKIMHEFLHIFGLCADSFSHIDLIDIFFNMYNIYPNFFNLKKQKKK